MEPDNRAPSLIQFYELTTQQIAREQTLVNNRTTWQNAFQGFLFTAFVLALRINVPPNYLRIITIVLPLLGIWTCFVTWLGISAAYEAMDEIKDRWRYRADKHEHLFPPAFSTEKPSNRGRITNFGILLGCIVAWGYILLKFAFA